MNFFSDERAAEMRELFFESAAEQLQNLNDQGLELEKNLTDLEVLREVRRTVHTLKGDSAACGYQELSELAHLLEDALTPEVAAHTTANLAEIVLIAADTFSSMLSAYRGKMQPPAGHELREQIESLTRKPDKPARGKKVARFAWSEYENLLASDAGERGESVFNIALTVDENCPMRGAALQLIRNVLAECGTVLAIVPDQGTCTRISNWWKQPLPRGKALSGFPRNAESPPSFQISRYSLLDKTALIRRATMFWISLST